MHTAKVRNRPCRMLIGGFLEVYAAVVQLLAPFRFLRPMLSKVEAVSVPNKPIFLLNGADAGRRACLAFVSPPRSSSLSLRFTCENA